jgi:hypothetical protein
VLAATVIAYWGLGPFGQHGDASHYRWSPVRAGLDTRRYPHHAVQEHADFWRQRRRDGGQFGAGVDHSRAAAQRPADVCEGGLGAFDRRSICGSAVILGAEGQRPTAFPGRVSHGSIAFPRRLLDRSTARLRLLAPCYAPEPGAYRRRATWAQDSAGACQVSSTLGAQRSRRRLPALDDVVGHYQFLSSVQVTRE